MSPHLKTEFMHVDNSEGRHDSIFLSPYLERNHGDLTKKEGKYLITPRTALPPTPARIAQPAPPDRLSLAGNPQRSGDRRRRAPPSPAGGESSASRSEFLLPFSPAPCSSFFSSSSPASSPRSATTSSPIPDAAASAQPSFTPPCRSSGDPLSSSRVISRNNFQIHSASPKLRLASRASPSPFLQIATLLPKPPVFCFRMLQEMICIAMPLWNHANILERVGG